MSVTPLWRNSSRTDASAKALRSLTRQVRHQLAVKFTSSGRPPALNLPRGRRRRLPLIRALRRARGGGGRRGWRGRDGRESHRQGYGEQHGQRRRRERGDTAGGTARLGFLIGPSAKAMRMAPARAAPRRAAKSAAPAPTATMPPKHKSGMQTAASTCPSTRRASAGRGASRGE